MWPKRGVSKEFNSLILQHYLKRKSYAFSARRNLLQISKSWQLSNSGTIMVLVLPVCFMSPDFSISTSTLNINVLFIFKVLFFVYSRIAPRSCFTCRPSSVTVSAALDNPLKLGQSKRRDQRQGWLRSHACNLICDQHVGPYIKAESYSPTLSSRKMVRLHQKIITLVWMLLLLSFLR